MKRLFIFCFIILCIFNIQSVNAQPVTLPARGVFYAGEHVIQNPFRNINGSGLVAFRAIGHILGWDIDFGWTSYSGSPIWASFTSPDDSVIVRITEGSDMALINGHQVQMLDGQYRPVRARIIDESFFVPLRFFHEHNLIPVNIEWFAGPPEVVIVMPITTETTQQTPPTPSPTPPPQATTEPTPNTSMADTDFMLENIITVETSNFSPWKYQGLVTSQIVRNIDGSILELNAGDKSFTAILRDRQGNRIFNKEIDFELPIFGAFFVGKEYNFAAFGNNNPDESRTVENYRIVKYDKLWNKIDSVSFFGTESGYDSSDAGNSVNPFGFASARFAEYNNMLVFHTGRIMFKSSDGINHQAVLYVFIEIPTMTVIEEEGAGWVSHSFDQYPIFLNGRPVFLDHGDAFPRGLVVQHAPDSQSYFYKLLPDGSKSHVWQSEWGSFFDWDGDVPLDEVQTAESYRDSLKVAYMLEIPGTIGDNRTDTSVGGFAASSTNLIAVANILPDFNRQNTVRDIYVLTLPLNFEQDAIGNRTRLATFSGTNKTASVPRMVQLDNDIFAVIWEEYDTDFNSLGFILQYIDGTGQAVGSQIRFNSLNALISDMFKLEWQL